MGLGRTIKLFMTEGVPSGVIVAELSLFTGLALIAPRASLQSLMARIETSRAGVYLLMGPDPATVGADLIYVGETDRIARRLLQHDGSADMQFFDRICVIVSKDEMLTKGHCLYLESSLIAAIKSASRVNILNVKAPEPRGLPEADIADMDGFLDQLGIMLPVLGFDVLRSSPTRRQTDVTQSPPLILAADEGGAFIYEINGAVARMEKRGGEYVILTGSTAVASESDSIAANVRAKRRQYLANGVMVRDGSFYRFTSETGYGSPSAASGMISGRSDNGRQSWKAINSGRSLNQLGESALLELSLDDLDLELSEEEVRT